MRRRGQCNILRGGSCFWRRMTSFDDLPVGMVSIPSAFVVKFPQVLLSTSLILDTSSPSEKKTSKNYTSSLSLSFRNLIFRFPNLNFSTIDFLLLQSSLARHVVDRASSCSLGTNGTINVLGKNSCTLHMNKCNSE